MFSPELRTSRERTLRTIGYVVSGIAWLALLISIVGALYGVIIAVFVAMAHALWLAHVRGNAVRLGPQQLPHLWNKVVAASQRLGLPEPPATYLMQSGGVLNAFATKLLGRRFVVLYSELVDACDRGDSGTGPSEIDFVIAHEVAHIAAGHLSWILLPLRIVPLLGPAYSRACEYTCDRAGHAVVGSLEVSSRALVILAAGGRASRTVNLDAYVEQRHESGRFWMAVYELNSTHPYLPKRIAALREQDRPGTAPAIGRNMAAYPLAPMFGAISGGAASAPLMMVAVIGVMAAVAIPGFERYMQRSKEAQAELARRLGSAEASAEPGSTGAPPDTSGGVLRGDRFDWTLTLPGPKWEVVPTAQARQQNRLADRWLTRADLDAHVMVIGEHIADQPLTLDAFAKAVTNNTQRAATRFKIVRQSAIGEGRLIEARSVVQGMELMQLFGLFIRGGNAYQVYAFAPVSSYGQAKQEMMAAIASFEPPANRPR